MRIKDFEVLSAAAQIRAIAREDRLRMVSLLAREALTVSSVARKLGMAPNRAHYHVRQLCRHGLLREVGTGKRRYREERYYEAVARNFLMDPQIACGDSQTSTALIRFAESAFLDWRRKEILDLDLAEVAGLIVNECLGIRSGETVVVMFGPQGLELSEAALVELRAIGSRPHPTLWSRNVVLRTLDRNDPETLAQMPFLDPEVDERLDAVIFVSSSMPQGDPPNAAQQARLPLLLDAVSRWQRGLRARRIRYLEFDLPHRGSFAGSMAAEQCVDIYWRCVRTDYRALGDRAARLLARIAGNRDLDLSCPRGTKLTVKLDQRFSHVNDGVISEDDVNSGRVVEVIPAGSLQLLPIVGSATGTFAADYVFVGGQHVWDVKVEIQEGRIVQVEAPEGAGLIREAIARASGDTDCLATVSFGLNPAGRGPTGFSVLDGCLQGSVVLSFGNNELLGGNVRATLDLGLPSSSITVRGGDTTLIDGGKLVQD